MSENLIGTAGRTGKYALLGAILLTIVAASGCTILDDYGAKINGNKDLFSNLQKGNPFVNINMTDINPPNELYNPQISNSDIKVYDGDGKHPDVMRVEKEMKGGKVILIRILSNKPSDQVILYDKDMDGKVDEVNALIDLKEYIDYEPDGIWDKKASHKLIYR